MEAITKIPGLQHMSEDIFKLLDKKSLMNCRLTNSSWKNVLDQSNVWMEKMKLARVPKDVQESWKNLAKTLAKQLDDEKIDWMEKFNWKNLPIRMQRQWKALEQVLDDDPRANEFVLILIKICDKEKPILPLEAVVKLEEANKHRDLVEFILEHENPSSKVSDNIRTIWP